MAKLRVYDLAKELGLANKEVMTILDEANKGVKSHSSNLEDDQVKLVRDKIRLKAVREKAAKDRPDVVRMSVKHPVVAGQKPAAPGTQAAVPSAAKRISTEKTTQKSADDERAKLRERLFSQAKASHDVAAKAHPVEQKPVAEKVEAVPAEPQAPVVEAKAPEAPEAVGAAQAPAPVETAPAEVVVKHEEPVAEVKPAPAPEAPAVKAEEPKVEAAPPSAPAAPEAQKEAQPKGPAVTPKELAAPPQGQPQQPQGQRPPYQQRPGGPPSGQRPPYQQRPGGPPSGQRPPFNQPRPSGPGVQPQQPQGPAQAFKKPHPKGPKPVRPETEVLEEVSVQVPVISAKLKNRLQPVKKAKTTAFDEQARKDASRGGKQPDFRKGGGKNQRYQNRYEKVEEPATTVARKRAIKVTEGITVKDFAEKIGAKSGEVMKKLFDMGIMATINQPIDMDAAVIIADSYGLKIEITPITDEEAFVEEATDREEDLSPRPPVVTIMGHVDHGKTSLLDAIRKTNVTGGEAGGITQHIGAYKVRLNEKEITFLDTPGHEAFTAMRARGAQITDIVVLVVAADDGVRPQTVEALNHAKAAKVPIIVAMNKIDKPEADAEKVKRELSDHGLVPEEWGGEVIFVPVSAKKHIGLENLLEMILLQAEVMELKANPHKMGRGTIVEAKLDKGRGPVATVLVSAGTIRPGDAFVTGIHSGRIRMLLNDKGKKEKEAGPATPVEIIGLSGVPGAGDSFVVMEDEKKARQVAQSRMEKQRMVELASRKRVTLDDLFSQIQTGVVKELNIIIKADVQGSVEAVSESLQKLSTEAVKLKVIHGSVGAITESDINLASASNAIIIGFNIRPEPKASQLAETEGVDIRLYNIIYNAIDEVRAAMEGLLEPTLREKVLGRAEVRQTFSVPKMGTVGGCYVLDGMITRVSAGARVLRDNVVVFEGKLGSLKRFKEDAKEVQAGYECGMSIENFNDIKVGDIIEVYDIEKLATKL
jgi:translation initiation factor IF-2